jgi:hypothetical protein
MPKQNRVIEDIIPINQLIKHNSDNVSSNDHKCKCHSSNDTLIDNVIKAKLNFRERCNTEIFSKKNGGPASKLAIILPKMVNYFRIWIFNANSKNLKKV